MGDDPIESRVPTSCVDSLRSFPEINFEMEEDEKNKEEDEGQHEEQEKIKLLQEIEEDRLRYLNKIPPDLESARQHGNSNKVHRAKGLNDS